MKLKDAMILACKKYNYGMERFHLQKSSPVYLPGRAEPVRKSKSSPKQE